ncbi:MAG: peptidase E [Winogradskyella sp.]|nr:peptidase E [Winogradskyella sp.]
MQSLRLIIAFLLFPILLSNSSKHDYFVSVTQIEYSEKQQSLQIISQIFIDDFEKLLRERFDKSITLKATDESEVMETYMYRYLVDKLKISVNDAPVQFKFIGKEYKDDIVYCYLEVDNITDVQSIEVSNRALFDIIPEQQNILRLKLLGKNKSFLLLPDNDSCVLNFN